MLRDPTSKSWLPAEVNLVYSFRVPLQQGNVKPGVSAVEISDADCGFATS